MKIFLFALIALLGFTGASAITLEEAFKKISEVPGVAVSDIPQYDILKEGLDWGKAAMLMGASNATLQNINDILGEITEAERNEVNGDNGAVAIAYKQPTSDGHYHGLMVAIMSNQGINNCMILLAQGGDNIMEVLTLN